MSTKNEHVNVSEHVHEPVHVNKHIHVNGNENEYDHVDT